MGTLVFSHYSEYLNFAYIVLKETPHWLEISNIGQILEIFWTHIGDFINNCPINVQYWTNLASCKNPLLKFKQDENVEILELPSKFQ